MHTVKVKPGCTHRSGQCVAGDVIQVTDAEFIAFGDKFERGFHVETTSATAAAMEFAEATGLDLSEVSGSGRDGRITKGDVEAFVVQRGA